MNNNSFFNKAVKTHPAQAEVKQFAEKIQFKEMKQLNVKIDVELYKIAKNKATEQNLKLYEYIEKLIKESK